MNWNLFWWMFLPFIILVMIFWRVKHPASFRSTFGWIRRIRGRNWVFLFLLVAVFAGGVFTANMFRKEQRPPKPAVVVVTPVDSSKASPADEKDKPEDHLTAAEKTRRRILEAERKAKGAAGDTTIVTKGSSGNIVTVFLKGQVSAKGTRDTYLFATLVAFALGCGFSWLIKNTLLDMGIALITATATSHFLMTWIKLGSDPRDPEGGWWAWKLFAFFLLFFFILGCSRARTRST